ncbi:hypothetical protein LC040_12035 [Bacillus tianshenii]|nr:hypothetical protein LC040_12035 [Bacillus tianshenii]
MNLILNGISVFGTFLIVFSLLYFIQHFTLGLIPFFKKEVKGRISIGDIVFPITSLAFIIIFIDFYHPY